MKAINSRKVQGGRGWSRAMGRWTFVVASSVAVAFVSSPASARDEQKSKGKKEGIKYSLDAKDAADKGVLNRPNRSGIVETAPVPSGDVKGPKPIITVEEPIHDFGVVWVGPTLNHSFVVKNTGDAPLQITKVKPSCGCTIAGAYPRAIAPGESGEFPFAVQSTKLHSRFSKFITISSNDPVTPEMRLQIRGEIKQYVDVTPAHANFGRIVGDDPQERLLNIQNNTDKPLNLELLKENDGGFKFDLITKEEGQRYELRVRAEPPFDAGMLKADAILSTNIDEQKTIQINARAVVPERLDIQPQSILVADRPGDTRGLTRVIRFTNYGEQPVNLVEATADDPQIKLTTNERTPGKSYTVLVELPPGYEPPAGGRKITLKTNDTRKPFVEIPVLSPAQERAAKAPEQPRRPAEGLVGQMAPAVNTQTVEGRPVNNDTFKENVTVLDFFAVNCGFCKKQLPRVETVRRDYDGKAVRFIAVGQTMRTPYSESDMRAKLDEFGFKGELVYDPGNTLGGAFQARSFPTMVIVGKNGKVEAVNVGNVADLESRMKTQLNALLAGKAIPETPTAQAPPKPQERPRPEHLVGKPAPKFSLATMDGKPAGSDAIAEAPATILNFVAPNCGFCKRQLPRLEEVRKKYAEKGVRLVTVSQTMRSPFEPDKAAEIFKEAGWEGEIAINHDNSVGGMFNVSGFPTMVVLGKGGKVEAVNVGNVADLETRVPKQLDALLSGKPIPDEVATKPPAPTPQQPPRRPAEAMVGKPVPAFSLTTYDGKALSSDGIKKSSATVLNFVAPNCGFCKRQLPNVEKVRQEFESKGVRFVNVSQTMRQEFKPEDAKKIFDDTGAKLEFAVDSGNQVGRAFQATSYPTMVVVDKNGNIAHVNVGARPDLEKVLKEQLSSITGSQ
jgi:thiol-disulfide isomerase/thioredoxin